MKTTALLLTLALFCADASAEICIVREGGNGDPALSKGGCPLGINPSDRTYSKNSEECPQPKSYCSGINDPIGAVLECRGIGGGVLWCGSTVTSVDNALTYNWTFTHNVGNQVVVNSGVGGATMEAYCQQNTAYEVRLVVTDIFGRTETVTVNEMCMVGSEN